jgi:Tfp pilus assembly protein PilX
MINVIRNQKGIALISTLMLLVLGFAIVAILFRLTTRETKLASLEQGYTTALDAAKAGTDLFIYMVQNGVSIPPVPGGAGAATPFGTSALNGQCLALKMSSSPQATSPPWPAPCPANAATTNPAQSPDITLTLSGYTVNVKVIDNRATAGTDCTPPCACLNGCYYYTVISQALPATGTGPQAEITFVYRYDQ